MGNSERERPVTNRPPSADVRTTSNGMQLSGRQWIAVGVYAAALYLLVPPIWERVEPLDPDPDYRLPYDLSADYWLYDRFTRLAAARCDTVLVGDSVVWGQYVTPEQTLSHHLNALAGRERFANLGLDGAHPAALAGLLEHYAGGVSNKNVVLHCNPLWMSSRQHDLQVEEAFRFNHPRLVPQFVPRIPCYREETSRRIGIVVERHVPFSGWTTHLQSAYFDKKDIPSWTLDHPYDNPLNAVTLKLPPSDRLLRHSPVPWTERDIKKQAFAWVDPETSIQWRSFQRAVEILEGKGNRVFVLVGPFNEHMLTDAGRDGYARVKQAIEDWLREKRVAYLAPPPLPSEEFADASHPLDAGYARLARELMENGFFKEGTGSTPAPP